MKKLKLLFFVLILTIIFAGIAFAASISTTMTWVVPTNKSHTVDYSNSCSQSAFYFVESDANLDGYDIDGNAGRVAPTSTSAGSAWCQSGSVASMLITNNGNAAINLDGNFDAAFSGVDTNLVLKVWMGNGSGCGTGGFGGYAKDCTVTGSNPVTQTTCRQFNSTNATTAGRLVTSLAINDSNQLCFSGDFNGGDFNSGVSVGSHAVTFRTTSG